MSKTEVSSMVKIMIYVDESVPFNYISNIVKRGDILSQITNLPGDIDEIVVHVSFVSTSRFESKRSKYIESLGRLVVYVSIDSIIANSCDSDEFLSHTYLTIFEEIEYQVSRRNLDFDVSLLIRELNACWQ